MSIWNYRVIRQYNEETDTSTYQVHEVYYDEQGNIEGMTESSIAPMGESMEELRDDMHFYLKALEKPVLREKIRDGKGILVIDED